MALNLGEMVSIELFPYHRGKTLFFSLVRAVTALVIIDLSYCVFLTDKHGSRKVCLKSSLVRFTWNLSFFVFNSQLLLLSTQALADQLLHHVCRSLLRIRHLRNVHVLLVQATGQRARGGIGSAPANEHGTDQLLAPRVPHGAAPRCHGHRLLPCFCGNCHTLLFLLGWDWSQVRAKTLHYIIVYYMFYCVLKEQCGHEGIVLVFFLFSKNETN